MADNNNSEIINNVEKTNTLKIHTPEGIVFSLHLAGPVSRFLAWLTDLGCILVISNTLSALIGILGIISPDLVSGLRILTYFVTSIAYSVICEWYWSGQSVGKKLLHLRVIDAQGLYLKFNQIVIRNLLRFVDTLPMLYMVGGIAMLISGKAQRVGDIAANTIVVRNPKMSDPDFSQLFTDKFNSFRNYPHIAARLLQNTTPEEAEVALQAILRRNSLDPVERITLFKQIADHFKTIVAFPQECTDGLSDEQYIRNVVSILFLVDGK